MHGCTRGRASRRLRLGQESHLTDGVVDINPQKRQEAAEHVLAHHAELTGHDESDAEKRPDEHDESGDEEVDRNTADIRGGDVDRYKAGTSAADDHARQDDGPEAGKGKVEIPEDGAHLGASALLEEVLVGAVGDHAGDEDELTALQGEAERERGEDAEHLHELGRAERKAWVRGLQEVDVVGRGDKDEHPENIYPKDALHGHQGQRQLL